MDEKKTILVVDDEPDIIHILKMMLEKQGHTVISADNGVEALSRVKERRPDVILLDRQMPEMSGDETLTRLKDSPGTSSIPVILLTSMDKYDDISGGYKLGAECYITKPFTRSQIANGIKLVLARRPGLADPEIQANIVPFLKACHRLTSKTRELVERCASQDGLSPSQWLYQGLEIRLKKEQNKYGNLRAIPEWMYVFRGWGVDFYNCKTEEQLSLAIGPGGRSDTFDGWRAQSYIETEAQRGGEFVELNAIIKGHSEAIERLIENARSRGWIEHAKAESTSGDPSIEAQLVDRWVVSPKGIEALSQARSGG